MKQESATSRLKKTISMAEEVLLDTENSDNSRKKRKHKSVKKALENAYALLNSTEYTQLDVDRRTDEIIEALQDEHDIAILWIFLFGLLLSGALIFTVYQTYSFLEHNWDREHHITPEWNENVSRMVKVNYKETNIVNLEGLMTVSDSVGLKNPAQEFQISNDAGKLRNLKYEVRYNVNILELNDKNDKVIDKKYLKYRLSYKDKNGYEKFGPIKTFADLKKNPDGSYLMLDGTQVKNGATDFKVVIWLSSTAGNDQQGRSYTFMFKVNAAIAKI